MKVWQFIEGKQAKSIRVILLYVLQSTGSSPGRQGFKMAVSADGDFYGTIGGGIMEHKFVELAKSKLQEQSVPSEIFEQIHDKTSAKHQSGMICSGKQTLFIYEIQPTDKIVIESIIKSLQQNKNGTLTLVVNGISFSEQSFEYKYQLELSEDEFSFVYKERTGFKNVLHIIGGGHCSLALSRLMQSMDFYIHVYEERAEINTLHANHFVQEKHVVNSYNDLNELIQGGEDVYVVIMTFGYRSDDMALKALIGKTFRYIGMLGSKAKIKKMFDEYRAEKINTALLEKIKAPIGLFIKSETTDEIAVSIAAEIISVKNNI
ncbi:MAG: XdhC family protein [Bacteroidota bacterium]